MRRQENQTVPMALYLKQENSWASVTITGVCDEEGELGGKGGGGTW